MDPSRYRVHERGPKQRRVAKLRFHATHAARQGRPRGSSWSRQGDVAEPRARTLPQACRRRQDLDPQIAAHAHNHRAVCGRSLAVCRAVGRRTRVDSKSSPQAADQASRDRMAIGFKGTVIELMFDQSGVSEPRRQVGARASLRVGSAASAGGCFISFERRLTMPRSAPATDPFGLDSWRMAACRMPLGTGRSCRPRRSSARTLYERGARPRVGRTPPRAAR